MAEAALDGTDGGQYWQVVAGGGVLHQRVRLQQHQLPMENLGKLVAFSKHELVLVLFTIPLRFEPETTAADD